MKEIIENILETLADEELNSKVEGRRNWVIRVENWSDGRRVIDYRGGFGEACRMSKMCVPVYYMCERKIRWYEFTYKKDYEAAVKKLVENGVYDHYGIHCL